MEKIKTRAYKLLRWSEKYTKTDMIQLTRTGAWSTISHIGTAFGSFVLAVLIARFVDKDIYGEYKYIISIVAMLSVFSLTGLGTSVFQSVARGFDGSLREGFWQNIRWNIVVFTGGIALAIYYFFIGGNMSLAIGILVGSLCTPFLGSVNLFGSFLGGKNLFIKQTIEFDFWGNIIPIAALIVAALVHPTALTLVIVYFIANTLVGLYYYLKTVRTYKPDKDKRDPGLMNYAKHLSVMNVFSGFANSIDQILLFHFGGAVNLAIYNFATAIPDQVKGPMKTIGDMITSRFAKQTKENIDQGMGNKILWLTMFTLIIIILYAFAAPFIYHIFFPRYGDAIFYSQIYAISLLTLISTPMGSYMTAHKEIKAQYGMIAIGPTFQVVAMIIGVVYAGLIGLVVARIVSRIFGSLITAFFYFRAIKHTVPQ